MISSESECISKLLLIRLIIIKCKKVVIGGTWITSICNVYKFMHKQKTSKHAIISKLNVLARCERPAELFDEFPLTTSLIDTQHISLVRLKL